MLSAVSLSPSRALLTPTHQPTFTTNHSRAASTTMLPRCVMVVVLLLLHLALVSTFVSGQLQQNLGPNDFVSGELVPCATAEYTVSTQKLPANSYGLFTFEQQELSDPAQLLSFDVLTPSGYEAG